MGVVRQLTKYLSRVRGVEMAVTALHKEDQRGRPAGGEGVRQEGGAHGALREKPESDLKRGREGETRRASE